MKQIEEGLYICELTSCVYSVPLLGAMISTCSQSMHFLMILLLSVYIVLSMGNCRSKSFAFTFSLLQCTCIMRLPNVS